MKEGTTASPPHPVAFSPAHLAFQEAEALQQEMQPQYPLLYSLPGYRYCELLLEQLAFRVQRLADAVVERSPDRSTATTAGLLDVGIEGRPSVDEVSGSGDPPTTGDSGDSLAELQSEIEAVRNRAEMTLSWGSGPGILDVALNHLALCRTWLLESQVSRVESQEQKEGPALDSYLSALDSAQRHLNESVTLLRQAGQQNWIPVGLLHRSALWRAFLSFNPKAKASGATENAHASRWRLNEEELFSNAERDLSEAETIAERGSMLIFQIEAALERARLYLTLASANSAPRREPSAADSRAEAQRTRSEYLEMAREKLAEAKRLVQQTERPYEPHVPDWDEWQPPEYVGVLKKGQLVGYHCRNQEIEHLAQILDQQLPD